MFNASKDPQAVLDYGFDWSEWLGADTIASSSWVASAGITNDSTTNTTLITSITLSGGVAGESYTLTNTIVTANGLQDDRSIRLTVKNR